MKLIIFLMILSSGCASYQTKEKAWEDGVVYGARVLYNGDIDEKVVIAKARRLRHEEQRFQEEFDNWRYGLNK